MRLSVAVAMAVTRKTTTEAIDLTESLGIPQSPWPLVHPFDSSVPTPTSSPATMRWEVAVEVSSPSWSKGRVGRTSRNSPEKARTAAEADSMPRRIMLLSFVDCTE